MKLSTQESGPEGEELLTDSERYAVNEVCRKIFKAWELEDEPCEWIELMTAINAGTARAVKAVRDLKSPKGAA